MACGDSSPEDPADATVVSGDRGEPDAHIADARPADTGSDAETDAGPTTFTIGLGSDLALEEGESFTLEVNVSGAEASSLSFEWDWGDGSTSTGATSLSHSYPDEGNFEITVTAQAIDGSTASARVMASVSNVAPTLSVGSNVSWVPQRRFELEGLGFDDPGMADSFSVTIDWGDGETTNLEPSFERRHDLRATHQYLDEGIYTIQVSIEDGDGGQDQATIGADIAFRTVIRLDVTVPSWVAEGSAADGFVKLVETSTRPISLSLIEAPAGMTLDDARVLNWTPTAADVGLHQVTVQASDGLVTASDTAEILVVSVQPQISAIVGPAGGLVEVTDSASPLFGLRLEIPAGALSQDTTIGIGLLAMPAPGDAAPQIGSAFELLPAGTEFAVPVTLTVPYGAVPLDASIDEGDIGIELLSPLSSLHSEVGAQWLPVDSDVDVVMQEVTALLDHFSTYRLAPRGLFGNSNCLNTTHFNICYYLWGGPRPLADGVYQRSGLAPGYTPSVPDYVEDLAFALERAHAAYQQAGYDPGARLQVLVRDLGRGNGMVSPLSPRTIKISNAVQTTNATRARVTQELLETAAHELFHTIQLQRLGRRALLANALGFHWLMESTAVAVATEVFPWSGTLGTPGNADAFGFTSSEIDRTDQDGYDTFPIHAFLRQRLPAANFPYLLFNPVNSEIPAELGEVFGGSRQGQAYVYRRLGQLAPNPTVLWHEFALAYQLLRWDSWIDQISGWNFRNPLLGVNPLSGDETESSPGPNLKMVFSVSSGLAPGGVITAVLDPSQAQQNEELDGDCAELVLTTDAPTTVTVSGWVVEPNNPARTPVLVETVAASGELRVPLSQVEAGTHVAATFYNPPNANVARLSARAHFDQSSCADGGDVDAGDADEPDADEPDTGEPDADEPPDAGSSSLSVSISGSGSITSDPPGISCPGTCSASFDPSDTVTLTADADPGSRFLAFGGDCSGSACVVSMTNDRSVSASFESCASYAASVYIDWRVNCGSTTALTGPSLPAGDYLVTALESAGVRWGQPWSPPNTGWQWYINCSNFSSTMSAPGAYATSAEAWANISHTSEIRPYAGGVLRCGLNDNPCGDNQGGIAFSLELYCP